MGGGRGGAEARPGPAGNMAPLKSGEWSALGAAGRRTAGLGRRGDNGSTLTLNERKRSFCLLLISGKFHVPPLSLKKGFVVPYITHTIPRTWGGEESKGWSRRQSRSKVGIKKYAIRSSVLFESAEDLSPSSLAANATRKTHLPSNS